MVIGSAGSATLVLVVFPQEASKAPASSVMMGFAFMCAQFAQIRWNAKAIFSVFSFFCKTHALAQMSDHS
jgi:hypothetical protein